MPMEMMVYCYFYCLVEHEKCLLHPTLVRCWSLAAVPFLRRQSKPQMKRKGVGRILGGRHNNSYGGCYIIELDWGRLRELSAMVQLADYRGIVPTILWQRIRGLF